MKKLLLILLCLPMIGFGQKAECVKHKEFGDISICLPEIDGLIECSSDSVVSYWSKVLKSDNEVTLGWYFNENKYTNISASFEEGMYDYFKIFSLNNFVSRKIQDGDFNEFERYIKSSEWDFLDDWDLAKKIEFISGKNVSGDKPIYIEVYTPPTNKIRSYVGLTKIIFEGKEDIVVSVLNIIEIQKRIIFYAYYLPYNGIISIDKAKAKSDYFGLKLLEVNLKSPIK